MPVTTMVEGSNGPVSKYPKSTARGTISANVMSDLKAAVLFIAAFYGHFVFRIRLAFLSQKSITSARGIAAMSLGSPFLLPRHVVNFQKPFPHQGRRQIIPHASQRFRFDHSPAEQGMPARGANRPDEFRQSARAE